MSSEFSRFVPGRWSSHPVALRRQRLTLLLLGLAPLLVFAGGTVFALVEAENWALILLHFGRWAVIGATALCASLGAVMTLALVNMVSRTLGRRGGRLDGRDETKFPAWLLVLACFFWLVPWALLQFRQSVVDPKYLGMVQFVLNAMCFFPFVGILAWVFLARTAKESEKTVHPRFPILVGGLLLAIAILSLFTDVQALLSRQFPQSAFIRGLKPWMVRIVLFATLFPLGMVFVMVWRLMWCEPKPKKAKSGKGGEKSEEGDSEPESRPKQPKPAVARFLEDPSNLVGTGVRLDGAIKEKTLPETSPPALSAGGGTESVKAAHRALKLLMGFAVDDPLRNPTLDQFSFFTRFHESYENALETFLESEDSNQSFLKSDIILQGREGSGRTEALCACALYAAIVRGQRSLFFVPDRESAKRLASRLSKRLESLFLDGYFDSERLVSGDVDGWLDPGSGKTPPSILFATPQDVERSFFTKGASLSRERRDALRGILVEYGAVFVDDFLLMPLSVRTNLAFLLDKLRLLMAEEGVVPQFVVATEPLFRPDGIERLGERLFGLGQFDRKKNVLSLRPREGKPYWFGTLVVDREKGLDAASREVVSKVLGLRMADQKEGRDDVGSGSAERGCNVILYRKGIGTQEKAQLSASFEDKPDGSSLRVVSRLDELSDEGDAVDPDAVFYLSLTCGNADAALRLNLPEKEGGSSSPIFLRIAADGESEPAERDVFALVPDESALQLRAAHLRSVLPFIPRLSPVSAQIWSRFGISLTHSGVREAEQVADEGSRVGVKWYHDELIDAEAYSGGRVWPYLVLASNAGAGRQAQGLDYSTLPNTRERIWVRRDESGEESNQLLLAEPVEAESGSLRQIAVWKDARGNRLGETDLAHVDEMALSHDDDEYAVDELVEPSKSERDKYVLAVSARFRHGTDADYLVPVRTFSWNVPYGGLRVPHIGDYEAVASFRLERAAHTTFRVDGSIRGLMNPLGREMRSPRRDYSYDAYLSCFILLPDIDFDAEEEGGAYAPETLVRNCMNGSWRTDSASGFSPALTHALGIALRERLDGWSFFAMAPAFWIDGREGSVGRVALWLVEPANSGRSVYPLLSRLLQGNPGFRKDLFDAAAKALENRPSISAMRTGSRVAFAGEELDGDDVNRARRILSLLLDQAKREADAERRSERRKRREGESRAVRRSVDRYTDQEREFDEVVVAGLSAFEPTIDVTKFARDYGWDENRISDLFMDVLWNNPQIFYVSKRGKYQWWEDSDGKVVRFVVTDILYGIGRDELDFRQAELDDAVRRAMEVVRNVDDPVRRALLLHDWIVDTCEYDREAADEGDITPTARTVYSVLVRRKAVCEGYTMAYRYLLREAGIDSEEVLSEDMRHCWNYVRIGDSWYHVDVTWDDPVVLGAKASDSNRSRDNFLMSDSRARFTKHHGWQKSLRGLPPADDKRFDGRDWEAFPADVPATPASAPSGIGEPRS